MTDLMAMANNSTLQGGPIAQLIQAIGANSNIKVTFVEASDLKNSQGDIARAQTYHLPGSSNYTITINSDFLQGTGRATDLAVARDIVHEILHVYMMGWADQHSVNSNAGLNAIMNEFFAANNRTGIDQQHETMTSFVGYMGDALVAYYNGTFISETRNHSIDQPYCQSLAWAGLMNTDIYKSKAANDPSWADQTRAINAVEGSSAQGFMLSHDGTPILLPTPKGDAPCP